MKRIFLLFLALYTSVILCVKEPDIKQQNHDARLIVKEAAKYLDEHDLYDACHTFSKNPYWFKGPFSVVVIKDDGTIYTNPDDRFSIWQNISQSDRPEEQDIPTILERLESLAGKRNELLVYWWQNDLRYTYVEKVQKNGSAFYVTAEFYPLSKAFQTKHLVRSAIHLLESKGLKTTIANFNKPFFQRGVIFLNAYREDGVLVAHVEHPEWVGKNMINLEDEKGQKIVQKFLEVAKTRKKGWVDYTWHKTRKHAYVHRYIDPETQTLYAVLAAHYPDMHRNMIPRFIRQAASYLALNGQSAAIKTFNDPTSEFRRSFGSLEIVLFDEQGNELTNTYLHRALSDEFFENVINEADKSGVAWTYGQDRFTETAAYAEKVRLEGKTYYIATMYHLDRKKDTTELFVTQAVNFIQAVPFQEAMHEIGRRDGRFRRGNQFIFVYDMTGRCMAHGDNTDLIQRDLSAVTDQKGNPIVENLISIARKQQYGWATFNLRNSVRHTYVRRITKKIGKREKSLIVGSAFWG